MKHCNECNTDKPLDEFSIRNKERGTRNSRCKQCIRDYGKRHYRDNRLDYLQSSSDQKRRNKQWFADLKKTLSCEHCGEDHPAVLQFHHMDPAQKDVEVSVMIANGSSIRRVQDEIAKCIVLCANCHFKVHYNLRQIA